MRMILTLPKTMMERWKTPPMKMERWKIPLIQTILTPLRTMTRNRLGTQNYWTARSRFPTRWIPPMNSIPHFRTTRFLN